jgi:hypothetical protein
MIVPINYTYFEILLVISDLGKKAENSHIPFLKCLSNAGAMCWKNQQFTKGFNP